MARRGPARAGPHRRWVSVPAALFDFRDPLPMPAGAHRLVAALLDAAPRVGLALGLSSGRPVEATCPGVRRAAVVEVSTPGCVWAHVRCGLPDPGLVVVPRDAAVALADLLMGGPGEAEARAATPLEQSLVVTHLVPALRPLAEALTDRGVTSFEGGAASDEELPPGTGEVLAVPLDVELPSGIACRVTLCLPARSLLPAEASPAEAAHLPAAHAALADVPVDVALRLPPTRVSAEAVEDLVPGDVLRLDPTAAASLVGVLPDGAGTAVPVMTAALGRRGRRRAVVVSSLLPTHDGGR
jgi:hypothetical protein